MNYIKPDDVTSPKSSWELKCIIYDERDGGISVAYGKWEKSKVIAMRWNGKNEPGKELGNPQSTGHPTWFVLPYEIGVIIVKEILYKQVAGNEYIRADGLKEAVKWLISQDKLCKSLYER